MSSPAPAPSLAPEDVEPGSVHDNDEPAPEAVAPGHASNSLAPAEAAAPPPTAAPAPSSTAKPGGAAPSAVDRFGSSYRRTMERRDADLRRRLQPYMPKKQADETIAAARAASRAAIRAQLEAKKAEALERRLHGDSAGNAGRRPQQRGLASAGSASGARRKPVSRPTTVLATPLAAGGADAAASSSSAAGGGGGDGDGGGGGGGGAPGADPGVHAEAAEVRELQSMFGGERGVSATTGRPLDTDLTTPEALKYPWGGNAQRFYEASTLDRNREQRGLKSWDSTPHRNVPYGCRGIRLANEKEMPWGKSSKKAWEYSEAAGMGFATAALHKLDDGSTDDIAMLKKRRDKEDRQYADATNRRPWDFTPWHSVPPALRGITPITREPWQRDLQTYMVHENNRRAASQIDTLTYQAHAMLTMSEQATQPALLMPPEWADGVRASAQTAGTTAGRQQGGARNMARNKQRPRPGQPSAPPLLLQSGSDTQAADAVEVS